MLEEIYSLFKLTFPFCNRNINFMKRLFENSENHFNFKFNDDNKLIGITIINKSTVLLLAVHPNYQNRGIGSKLLLEAEKQIKDNGYNTLNIGAGYTYLTPGVPMLNNNVDFFVKRGYYNSLGNDETFDMALKFKDVSYSVKLGDTINGIKYVMATKEDKEKTLECVNDGAAFFNRFYLPDNIYQQNPNDFVLVAKKDQEVCAAVLVSCYGKTGSVGCTVTKKSFRHQQIATNMILVANSYLKSKGLTDAYLEATRTGLDKLYSVSGYIITNRYFRATKNL